MLSWNDIKISCLRVMLYLNGFMNRLKVFLGLMPFKHGIYGYYELKGLPCTSFLHVPKRIEACAEYDNFRPDDVILMTYPKAGTHFSGLIIADIFRESGKWDRKDGDRMNPLEAIPPPFMRPKLKKGSVATGVMADLDTESPRLMMTHLPLNLLSPKVQQGHVKVVHCTRNPKDVACSMITFLKKMNVLAESTSWDEFLLNYMNGKVIYGGYFEFLKAWYPHRNNKTMLNLKFEDMRQDLEGNVRRIAAFLNVDLTDEQVNNVVVANSFANRKKTAGQGHPIYRSGKSGGWRGEFTVEQNEMFNEWIKTETEGMADLEITYD